MSAPALTTVGVLAFNGGWNDFLGLAVLDGPGNLYAHRSEGIHRTAEHAVELSAGRILHGLCFRLLSCSCCSSAIS